MFTMYYINIKKKLVKITSFYNLDKGLDLTASLKDSSST